MAITRTCSTCSKTIIAIIAAALLKMRVCVFCPTSVIKNWERELEEFGFDNYIVKSWGCVARGGEHIDIDSDRVIIADEVPFSGIQNKTGENLFTLRQRGHKVILLSATPASRLQDCRCPYDDNNA